MSQSATVGLRMPASLPRLSRNQKVAYQTYRRSGMSTTSKAPTSQSTTDRIEKTTVLRAPRSRVWRALTDPAQFSQWFGATLKDTFLAGARVQGPVTSP